VFTLFVLLDCTRLGGFAFIRDRTVHRAVEREFLFFAGGEWRWNGVALDALILKGHAGCYSMACINEVGSTPLCGNIPL
jgi:hypothetical protein